MMGATRQLHAATVDDAGRGRGDRTAPARSAPIREKSRGTIAAYSGTVGALLREAADGGLIQRVRTYAEDHASDLQCALALLRGIEGLGIVVHGPAGCASALAVAGSSVPWAVTALDQRDSILGGDERLRHALRALHGAHRPLAIAVVATPVVAIINDDIDSVASELGDELEVPVFAVHTDGLRSKLSATGTDAAVHALFGQALRRGPRATGDHVNLLASGVSRAELHELASLLAEVGVRAMPFAAGIPWTALDRLASARLSVGLEADDSKHAGQWLAERHGVPFLDAPAPIGVAATGRWLVAVAEALGHAPQAALLAARHAQRSDYAVAALAPHRGARVFLRLPALQALGVAELLAEAGLELAGLSLPSLGTGDLASVRALAERWPQLPLQVGEGQAFEEANLLHKLRPDLLIARGAGTAHALALAVPVLDVGRLPLHGYAGASRLAGAIARRLAHPGLAHLPGAPGSGHTQRWLARSTHWYVKQEVR